MALWDRRGFAATVTDTSCRDCPWGEMSPLELHSYFSGTSGMPLGAVVSRSHLVRDCRDDGVYEVCPHLGPAQLSRWDAKPPNILAIKLRHLRSQVKAPCSAQRVEFGLDPIRATRPSTSSVLAPSRGEWPTLGSHAVIEPCSRWYRARPDNRMGVGEDETTGIESQGRASPRPCPARERRWHPPLGWSPSPGSASVWRPRSLPRRAPGRRLRTPPVPARLHAR